MFWRPTYLSPSAWLEHIPFAFWLIETHQPQVLVELGTHYGVSYFAFCQAVEKLGLDTRCFAVDTWKGDEQAGFYDEKIFEQVQRYNEAQYSGFSRLIRSTFDDAQAYFSDGLVDLLHIDGLHTFESVKHDFETWLPKLSSRAIVVMHDTNVRERQFGVFKFFEGLKGKYSSFEFIHGHGLGILKVGSAQNELMKRFFDVSENEVFRQGIHEVFSRLGRACADSFTASQQLERVGDLKKTMERQKKEVEDLKQSFDKVKDELNTRSKELTDAKTKLKNQVEQTSVELTACREEFGKVEKELEGRLDEIKVLNTTVAEKGEEIFKLEKLLSNRESEVISLRNQVQDRDKEFLRLKQEIEKKIKMMSDLELKAKEGDDKLAEANLCIQNRFRELATLTKMLDEKEKALGAAEKQSEEQKKEMKSLQAMLKEREDALNIVNKDLMSANKMLEEKDRALRKKGQEFERQKQKNENFRKTFSWRVTKPIRVLAKPFGSGNLKRKALNKQRDVVKNSGLFDAAWYLQQYPDVAKNGADPIEHYFQFGAEEGRNPSPNFDTKRYLRENPNLKQAYNPFYHYIVFGNIKRTSFPE
ncbi:MAG: class I SAM-dependent methyltransferase [Deltaproteobacteria bacterium]|nr:class I SAM-dependent methyltransferase [Deltaproteobacteria bacterium]